MQYQKAKRKRRYMPSIVLGLKQPGIAWAKIPNGYYSDINTFEVHDLNGEKIFADIAYKPDGGKPPETRVTYRFTLVWEGGGLLFAGHEVVGSSTPN